MHYLKVTDVQSFMVSVTPGSSLFEAISLSLTCLYPSLVLCFHTMVIGLNFDSIRGNLFNQFYTQRENELNVLPYFTKLFCVSACYECDCLLAFITRAVFSIFKVRLKFRITASRKI